MSNPLPPMSPYYEWSADLNNANGVQVVQKKLRSVVLPRSQVLITRLMLLLSISNAIGGTTPVYTVNIDPLAILIAMPYFVNGNAIDYLTSNAGMTHLIVPWIKDVLATLAALHEQGVVHGNISPHNILIRADKRAALVDAGFHTLMRSVIDPGQIPSHYHTQAPEMLPTDCDELRQPTLAGDIYSLVATVQVMFKGRLPSRSSNSYPTSFLAKLADGSIGEAERLEGVPLAVASALAGGCDANPTARPTARELLNRFANL
ncbi:hypothetical protein PLICRDRAFT_695513 [Plicaturopsis crispa FD-325 SS-3]|nr:hypothetical protein PLICRDRAFT_695513 [Plicaturopsis crispa FD-325 SS-3]